MPNDQDTTHNLYFSGKITRNADIKKIQIILSKVLKISESDTQQFFKGTPTKILKNISYERALDIKNKMLMIGAICEIEEVNIVIPDIKEQVSNKKSDIACKATNLLKRYIPFIFFFIVAFFLQYRWDFAIILTFVATIIFIHPLLIDKMNFLSPYYGSVDVVTGIKIRLIKQAVIGLLEVVAISLVAINFAAYSKEYPIFIAYFFFLILSYQILKYRLQKFNNNYLQTLRVFYFKDSLKLGILFSIICIIKVFPEKSFTDSIIDAVFFGDIVSAISTLNSATAAIASLLPFPLDKILEIIFNINILTGFVFNALTIFIYSINEIFFGVKREVFLWKTLLTGFFAPNMNVVEQNTNRVEEQMRS